MDPEPKGLRSIVLLCTVVVLLSGVVGFLLWWMASDQARDPSKEVPWSDVSRVTLHPVEFLPGSTAAEREKVATRLERLLTRPGDRPDPEAVQGLVALGEAAAPRLLDAFHGLFAKDGFRSDESRRLAAFLDVVLRKISRTKAYARFPFPRVPRPDADASDMEWTAKAWFQWWDLVRPASGSGDPPK